MWQTVLATSAGYDVSRRGDGDVRDKDDVRAWRPASDSVFQALCAGLSTAVVGTECPPFDVAVPDVTERQSVLSRLDKGHLASLAQCGVLVEFNDAAAFSDAEGRMRLHFLNSAHMIAEARFGVRPLVQVLLSSGNRPEEACLTIHTLL